jgi:vacuolar-type H+-ATPase subunit E/Vma4
MEKSKNIQKEKEFEITDEKRKQIYNVASKVRKTTLEEICPVLLDVLLESEKGLLKNELGKVIFHLQKNERLNTLIGFQKLIDGCLIVNPEKMFRILENAGSEAQEVAKKIKQIL